VKDYDAGRNSPAKGPTFRVAGEEWQTVPAMPFATLERFAQTAARFGAPASIAERNAAGIAVVVEMGQFFRDVLVDEQVDAWAALMADKRRCPPQDLLQTIMQDLVAEMTNRPTSPPSVSPAGRPTNGTPSTGAYSWPDAQTVPLA
jgi:hypothetical protein